MAQFLCYYDRYGSSWLYGMGKLKAKVTILALAVLMSGRYVEEQNVILR